MFQCLPSAGYNRHFPREVVYGPISLGGLEWERCESLQILEKVKFFLTHVRRGEKLEELIQVLTECVQLQSGLIHPILETEIQWQNWVEATWLTNLKQELDSIKGTITTNFKAPKIQRKFDRSIIEVFES